MASNIAVSDAQETPVAHTFVPYGPDKEGVYWFVDNTIGDGSGTALGAWRISMQLKEPPLATTGTSSTNRAYRAICGIHLPSVADADFGANGLMPAPIVEYTPRAFLEFVLPERATAVDRATLLKIADWLLTEGQFGGLVNQLKRVI